MSDESQVRAFWKRVLVCDGSYRNYLRGTVLMQPQNNVFYDAVDFDAALAFTEQRKREIREKQEEINVLCALLECTKPGPLIDDTDPPIYECSYLPESWELKLQRILAVLNAQYAELVRGVRPEALREIEKGGR